MGPGRGHWAKFVMLKPQIIRRVAIQSGLQYLTVIHIAYQESVMDVFFCFFLEMQK